MRKLTIFIEINGESVYVGDIIGNDSTDACFSYSESYLHNPDNRAISINLPLHKKQFDSQATKNFFEGLLPEGFTRRCVADWIHVDENDYLSILNSLGRECLGAIKVVDENEEKHAAQYIELSEKSLMVRWFLIGCIKRTFHKLLAFRHLKNMKRIMLII